MLPMYIQGVSASKASEYIDPKYVLNFEGMTTSTEVSNYLINTLGSKLHVNNVPNCTFTTARTGIGLRYSSCTEYAYNASLVPIFSIGPISIPKQVSISIDYYQGGSHWGHCALVLLTENNTYVPLFQLRDSHESAISSSTATYVCGINKNSGFVNLGKITYTATEEQINNKVTDNSTQCYIQFKQPTYCYYPTGGRNIAVATTLLYDLTIEL